MAEVQRDITFKPSQVISRSGQLITLEQEEVHVNGRKVGYVGFGIGESVSLIAPADEGTKAAIAEALKERRGAAPKSVISAPQIPDEDESSDDDE